MNSLIKSVLQRRLIKTCCCVPRQLTATSHSNRPNYYDHCFMSTVASSDFNVSANHLAVEVMKSYGVDNERILQQVKNMPALTNSNPETWKKLIETMLKHGFDVTTIVDIVVRCPKLLKITPMSIKQSWDCWMQCFSQHDLVRKLVNAHPEFLALKGNDVTSRCEHLKAIVGSYKFVAHLLMRCPHIMFQSLSDLEEVSDYISTKMVVRNAAEYYKSVALGCTIDEIKTKHVFLERCGKYKTPNQKQSDKIPTGNPSLSAIYDTSNKVFATKIAGVTLEEFVVFQSMYEKEMREISEDSGSDTDDSDDSDDE